MKQRNRYLDILRGAAVILMVFGHCLQYGNGTEFIESSGFFYNRLFQLIYSFHMPLFMLLSGYLFFYTAGKYRKTIEFIKNRWQRICLPIIGWQTFHYAVKGIGMLVNGESVDLDFLWRYVRSWFTDIWFLLAILYCSVIIFFIRKYLKDNIFVYLTGFVLTFITPDSVANMHLYKYMYPFFICGYLLSRYLKESRKIISGVRLKYLFAGAVVCFIALFCFWDIDAYIYTTGYTLLGRERLSRQFLIDMYRTAIGFAGSAAVTIGIKMVYDWKPGQYIADAWKGVSGLLWKIMSGVGCQSLCVYILSSEMVHWFLEDFSDWYHFSYLGTLIEAGILIGISYAVAVLISRIAVFNKILLGGK